MGFWIVKSEVKQQMCPWRLDSRPVWGGPLSGELLGAGVTWGAAGPLHSQGSEGKGAFRGHRPWVSAKAPLGFCATD